jgi:hypothetical protein
MTKQPLTRNLAEVLESLSRTLEAKAKKEKEAAAPDQPQNTKVQAKVVRLPYWNNRGRGTPNCFELKSDKRYLVRNLIYPVPNPDFPFLGVHFTRMIGGAVHAGPYAVLSFKREGYKRSDFALRDALESIGYSGFWRLSARHWSKGLRELWRSLSKKAFTRSLQRLICNAPSPAATSSLLIGQHIARQALS